MNMEIKIQQSIHIIRVFNYYGLHTPECPINPSHELVLASGQLALCMNCGIEWDVISLYETLGGIQRDAAVDELSRWVPQVPLELDWLSNTSYHMSKEIEAELTNASTFGSWLNRHHHQIQGTYNYDENPYTAIAFINLKGNLVLLPKAFDEVSNGLVLEWKTEWESQNLLRRPSDSLGSKRTQRIPTRIREAQGLSEMMRLYTFHRWETAELLGLVSLREKTA